MIFDKKGNAIIVTQEKSSIIDFVQRLSNEYEKIRNEHLIINLFSLKEIPDEHINDFLQLSKQHKAGRKSFVIVFKDVNYDAIPEDLVIVPTLQEAHDIIEMEEIERDLDL